MKASVALVKERTSGWRAIAFLILIAFTLQSFITQTHIHNATPASVAKIFSQSHGKVPLDDNPMDCPFCQAVAHDGALSVPSAPVLLFSAGFLELAAPALRLRWADATLTHGWQSRAPPRR